jgi:hypothetical protein
MTATRAGTVFDIGYQRYTGAREGRQPRAPGGLQGRRRTALGLGRGGRAKVLPWFFIALLVRHRADHGADRGRGRAHGRTRRGAGATCRPTPTSTAWRRSSCSSSPRSSRPSCCAGTVANGDQPVPRAAPHGLGLHLARWAAFLAVMVAAAWAAADRPADGLAMGDPAPVAYLRAHWLDIPRFLAAGVAMAAYATTLAMLTASFTTRRAYASVFLVGLFVITTPFTVGTRLGDRGAGRPVDLDVQPDQHPGARERRDLRRVSEMTAGAPPRVAGRGARRLVLCLDARSGRRSVGALPAAVAMNGMTDP